MSSSKTKFPENELRSLFHGICLPLSTIIGMPDMREKEDREIRWNRGSKGPICYCCRFRAPTGNTKQKCHRGLQKMGTSGPDHFLHGLSVFYKRQS
jgi:hypothetical protein